MSNIIADAGYYCRYRGLLLMLGVVEDTGDYC